MVLTIYRRTRVSKEANRYEYMDALNVFGKRAKYALKELKTVIEG